MQQLLFWGFMSVVLVCGSIGLVRATVDVRRDNRERAKRASHGSPESDARQYRGR